MKEWPGNKISCDGENLRMHDELCDRLEADKWTEEAVVNASCGIWAGMQVMKEHMQAEIEKLLVINQLAEEALKEVYKSESTKFWAAITHKKVFEALAEIAKLKRGV